MSRELQAILSTQGVTGLFRGLVPQLWLVLNPAIQLTVYEHLKSWAHAFSGHDTNHKLPDRCAVCTDTASNLPFGLLCSCSWLHLRLWFDDGGDQIVAAETSGILRRLLRQVHSEDCLQRGQIM